MSSQIYQSRMKTLQSDIASLRRKQITESNTVASKAARNAQIKRNITSSTSASSLGSYQREIQRNDEDAARAQEKIASLFKQIADKEKSYNEAQQRYNEELLKEQKKEQQKLQDSLKKLTQDETNRSNQRWVNTSRSLRTVDNIDAPEFDVFISHASEDKDEIVRALAESLNSLGFAVWYDEMQLVVGDSLRKKIDQGLSRSRFGIVVLSPDFLKKNWTQYELDGMVAREMDGQKVILPIWHKVTKAEVLQYSPSLADKVALNTTTYTVEEIAAKMAEVIRPIHEDREGTHAASVHDEDATATETAKGADGA